ncbi:MULTISPECIES: hypothetical protein [Streptomyces]|uniref:hypothetical protein n=1 Tax=Streptomyces TaxID=1883 RepID=UPI000765E9B9|nr:MULTISPECIES: hypothetical protein [Streptomyces]MBE4783936.1 hypothetical protein [Streptomyces caniscabiei]MBE4791565.1 hypothetical protein [Streptomyces caniscabiei]MDX3009198.1 hypothetical protein [Streptomyces caniscabiei]MDX3831366.1 hypothetical protein [Streptomyces europaeiscabiei]
MGFGSAGLTFFNPVARSLIEAGASDELKEKVLTKLIADLQAEDWDTELDSLQLFLDDPAIVRAFANNSIHWED